MPISAPLFGSNDEEFLLDEDLEQKYMDLISAMAALLGLEHRSPAQQKRFDALHQDWQKLRLDQRRRYLDGKHDRAAEVAARKAQLKEVKQAIKDWEARDNDDAWYARWWYITPEVIAEMRDGVGGIMPRELQGYSSKSGASIRDGKIYGSREPRAQGQAAAEKKRGRSRRR